jgi:glycosyl transferase family 2
MDLISHINGDGDLVGAWLAHYLRLGVTRFHLIVHGPASENAELHRLADRHPIVIADAYEGEFLGQEKGRRLNALIATLPDRWILLVDSDEFLEPPYGDLATTVRRLERVGDTALLAPMLQRLTADGSLDTPPMVEDVFGAFPLCSPDLYARMGVTANLTKYPLFRNSPGTRVNAGNHIPPHGEATGLSRVRGITHHFKWRRTVFRRLTDRANSGHMWRHESIGFLAYLEAHGGRLPIEGAFPYARREVIRRGLLRSAGWRGHAGHAVDRIVPLLPASLGRTIRRLARTAAGRGPAR